MRLETPNFEDGPFSSGCVRGSRFVQQSSKRTLSPRCGCGRWRRLWEAPACRAGGPHAATEYPRARRCARMARHRRSARVGDGAKGAGSAPTKQEGRHASGAWAARCWSGLWSWRQAVGVALPRGRPKKTRCSPNSTFSRCRMRCRSRRCGESGDTRSSVRGRYLSAPPAPPPTPLGSRSPEIADPSTRIGTHPCADLRGATGFRRKAGRTQSGRCTV